jgi:hypothetical protein
MIQLEFSKKPGREGRTRYRYVIDIEKDGKESTFISDDLQSGAGGGSLLEGFQSLLSFLSAAGESFRYAERRGKDGMEGENSNLFERELTEWAAQNSDEIEMARMELEEAAAIEE